MALPLAIRANAVAAWRDQVLGKLMVLRGAGEVDLADQHYARIVQHIGFGGMIVTRFEDGALVIVPSPHAVDLLQRIPAPKVAAGDTVSDGGAA